MKRENLSCKSLEILSNMHGFSKPVSSEDLNFLSAEPSGSRAQVSENFQSLFDLGMVSPGDAENISQTFTITEIGLRAYLDPEIHLAKTREENSIQP